jgi:hypothetical protein
MGCLGLHTALNAETVNRLRAFPTDVERLEYFRDDIEDAYFTNHPEWIAETDKAWDAIHRALTDGKLGWDNGNYPLNHVILGGELLYTADDFIMSLKTPDQVRDISTALKEVTQDRFRKGYDAIDAESYYALIASNDDYEYTWTWFQSLREFYDRAAKAGRHVLFTADQ